MTKTKIKRNSKAAGALNQFHSFIPIFSFRYKRAFDLVPSPRNTVCRSPLVVFVWLAKGNKTNIVCNPHHNGIADAKPTQDSPAFIGKEWAPNLTFVDKCNFYMPILSLHSCSLKKQPLQQQRQQHGMKTTHVNKVLKQKGNSSELNFNAKGVSRALFAKPLCKCSSSGIQNDKITLHCAIEMQSKKTKNENPYANVCTGDVKGRRGR